MIDVARLALAAVLLVAATAKALDPAGTRGTLRSFGVAPRFVAAGARALPLGEAVTAAALLVAPLARVGAALAVAMLALFSFELWRHRAVVTECNCFGALGGGSAGRSSQLRNAGLAVLAVAVVAGGGGHVPAWVPVLVAAAALAAGAAAHARRPGAVGRRAPERDLGERDTLHVFTGAGCPPCAELEADLPNWPERADLERSVRDPSAPRDAYGVTATPGALVVDRRGRIATPAAYGAAEIEALWRWWPESPPQVRSAFRSHGVAVEVATDDRELAARVPAALPAGAEVLAEAPPETPRWLLLTRGAGAVLYADGALGGRGESGAALLEPLAASLRLHIAEHAPEHAFVHAGVVAWHGRAIVVPGRSFTGKSTLVSALLRAGATYLSDEYAVIDRDGLIHPYPKPIALRRDGGHVSFDHDPSEFTALPAADGPLPLGAIVVAPYEAGTTWRPEPMSTGGGAMALIENAVGVRRDPARVLATIRAAAEPAVAFDAPRGESDETAASLLAHLSGSRGRART